MTRALHGRGSIARVRTTVAVAFALSALGAAAPAGAQEPGSPLPAGVAPAAAPAAVEGRLVLRAERVGPERAVLAGTPWRVRGTLTPFVAGQEVTVRFVHGRTKVLVRRVTLRRRGRDGTFAVAFRTTRPGRVEVRASHRATPQLATAVARPVRVSVLPQRAAPGSNGLAVRVLQQRLAHLGYVVGRRGSFDGRTARAVVAFRKVTGMARTQEADREVFRRLAGGQGAFRVRFPQHGRHVEADISRQVVALIGAGGRVERIYPTSSGAPTTPTILGSFSIYRKDPGTNALGMVHAAYFIRGYAIHGYASVPTYNASHGCLRVPVPDARSIFDWVRHGTRVDTYR